MKKILALILASLMLIALVACAEDTKKDTETKDPEVVEPVVEPTTPATILLKAFKDMKANGEYTDVESAANTLITNPIIPFMGGAMLVEEGWLQGFSADITGFKSGAVFMPMIGAIPFVGYVFELEEGADVNAFVQTLKDNADMRWLICVEAEEVVCEAVDNTVFFCMAKLSFEEEAPAEGDEFFEDLPVEDFPVEDLPVEDMPEEAPVVDMGGLTPANYLLKAFKDMKASGEYTDVETVANTLASNPAIPFMSGAMLVEEGFLQGFNEDITGFKSGAVFMPMIGSIPFVGYVFELEEGADVNAFVQNLNDKANMRWLICVAAEEVVCEAVDNTVFFCMAKTSFAE